MAEGSGRLKFETLHKHEVTFSNVLPFCEEICAKLMPPVNSGMLLHT
jgi:hypothetical protein